MRELRTVREINDAVFENENGRGGYVYANIKGEEGLSARIIRARTRKGTLEVYLLGSGKWLPATKVWQE